MQGKEAIFRKSKIFSILKDTEYKFNEPFLKQYFASDGSQKFKLSIMRCVKNKLVDSPTYERGSNKNTEKLETNLMRAKSTIFELAYCNKWDYFFTGTLDKKKTNREDLKTFNSKFKDFVYLFNKKYNCKISYLLIPELHSDLKSWHFHGFLAGVPEDRIYQFKIGDKMR